MKKVKQISIKKLNKLIVKHNIQSDKITDLDGGYVYVLDDYFISKGYVRVAVTTDYKSIIVMSRKHIDKAVKKNYDNLSEKIKNDDGVVDVMEYFYDDTISTLSLVDKDIKNQVLYVNGIDYIYSATMNMFEY